MKSICWITGSSFLDVDISLIPHINKCFDLFWIVFLQKESFYTFNNVFSFMQKHRIKGEIYVFPGRLRSFQSLCVYNTALTQIKKLCPDIYYINYLGLPYLFPLLFLRRFQPQKLIYACHDFIDHVQIPHRNQIMRYKNFIFTKYRNFQFFSKTQESLFLKKYDKKKTFLIPLNLKNFGYSNKLPPDDKYVFLFFGNIRKNKGLDVLIQAVNLLSQENIRQNFIVRIYGNCEDWAAYKALIADYNNFDLQIRRVENDEIPDLFSSAHFLVLPYRDVTQSGPLLIAYNYNLPVIAPDFSGFREYISDQETGFLFKPESATDLCRVLKYVLTEYQGYSVMKQKLSGFIKKELSETRLVEKYVEMFNGV